jgi:MFS family permease
VSGDRLPRRLVWTYYAAAATRTEGFVYPVLNLLLLARGVSVAELGTANAAFFAGLLLAEVPTGYVGDRLGRRNSLAISSTLVTLTLLAFTVASSFPAFCALFACWGVAVTFRSGSDEAWLYDTLGERADESAYTRIRGRGTAAFLVASAGTSLVGPFLYEWNHAAPFVAAAATTALGVPLWLSLPRNRAADGRGGSTVSFADAWRTFRTRFARPPLRGFVVATAAVLAVPELADVYVQPITVGDVGLPTTALGPLYAAFSLVSATVAARSERIREALGYRRWFVLVAAGIAVAFVAAAFVPFVAVPAFLLMRAGKSASYALRGQYLNDRLPSVGRATVLSTASLVYGVVFLLVRVGGGALAGAVGARSALAAVAVAACLVCAAVVTGEGF